MRQSTLLQTPLREKNRRCARLVHIHDKLSWKIQWKSFVRQEACTVSLQGEDVTAPSQAHECACTVEAIETNCCLQAGRVLQCVDLLGQAGGRRLQGLRQGQLACRSEKKALRSLRMKKTNKSKQASKQIKQVAKTWNLSASCNAGGQLIELLSQG